MLSGRRRIVVAVAAYAAVCVSLVTPLYQPLYWGHGRAWAVVVLLVAVHIGLGAAVARIWCVAAPGLIAVLSVAAAEGLAWLFVIFVVPVLFVATLVGWALGRFAGRWGTRVAIAAFAVALVPVGWATAETVKRANSPHVPPDVQQVLGDVELGNLCGIEVDRRTKRAERHAAEVLLDELHRHPDDIVTHTSYDADTAETFHDDITIRDLAIDQADSLRSQGGSCPRRLARQLDP